MVMPAEWTGRWATWRVKDVMLNNGGGEEHRGAAGLQRGSGQVAQARATQSKEDTERNRASSGKDQKDKTTPEGSGALGVPERCIQAVREESQADAVLDSRFQKQREVRGA